MGDDNDAVYRGVADDALQSQVVWTVLQDKTSAGATIAIVYDSNDSYSSDFKDAIMALDDGSRTLVTLDQPVTLEMDAAAVTAFTDAFNALSPAPTGMVSIGLAASAGKAMNAISSSFSGTLVVTDGQISDTFFDGLGADFITWLNDDANQIVGTTPYYEPDGSNTTAWVDRLSSVTGGTTAGPDNAFTPMMADCLYQISLAHMVGSAANDNAVEAVYQGMKTFKTATGDTTGRTAVAPTSAGLAAAKAAIDAGDSVYLDGASGPLLFSEVGDRHYSMQVYATLEIENDGFAYSWVVDKLWRGLEP
jgi:ethanolamine utilization microcompartment shell protein EutS